MTGLVAMGERAAVAEDRPTAINMNIVREKILADKKFFVAQHMGLKKTEAEIFWPVYDRYHPTSPDVIASMATPHGLYLRQFVDAIWLRG